MDGDRGVRAVAVAGQQLQQGAEPWVVIADPQLGDLVTIVVNEGYVVVALRPVDAAEQAGHCVSLISQGSYAQVNSLRSTRRSNRSAPGTPSHEPFVSPATGRDLGLFESSRLAIF